MFKLENEVREYFAELEASVPEASQGGIRLLLAERKRELLAKHRDVLVRQEHRAISLMRLPKYPGIKPRLVFCGTDDTPLWMMLRHTISSAPYPGRLGRRLYFFCIDENTGGLLGIVELNSDYNILSLRDKEIGWTRERRFRRSGLNHMVNVGTCVSVAPFGRAIGGKFQIVAVLTSEIIGAWERRYVEKVGAVVTTSLFGKSSIYNRLKEFKFLGLTAGLGIAHLDAEGSALLRAFLRANNILVRTRGSRANQYGDKVQMLNKISAMLKVERAALSNRAPKGVYYAETGYNSKEFLRGETDKLKTNLRPQKVVRDWWLERWFEMRYPKVKDEIEAFDPRDYRVDRQLEKLDDEIMRAKQAMAGPPAQRRGSTVPPAPKKEQKKGAAHRGSARMDPPLVSVGIPKVDAADFLAPNCMFAFFANVAHPAGPYLRPVKRGH